MTSTPTGSEDPATADGAGTSGAAGGAGAAPGTAGGAGAAPGDEATVYERVGGMPFFERLVDAFYEGVVDDPVLAPLYPEAPDFTGARHRLTLFLAQYWGGPSTYADERGHPMLRMRHMPFHVGPAERDRWLVHMAAALDAAAPPDDVREEMAAYFVRAAEHLRNDTGLPIGSARRPTLPVVP